VFSLYLQLALVGAWRGSCGVLPKVYWGAGTARDLTLVIDSRIWLTVDDPTRCDEVSDRVRGICLDEAADATKGKQRGHARRSRFNPSCWRSNLNLG
jgi:hypothetical protein